MSESAPAAAADDAPRRMAGQTVAYITAVWLLALALTVACWFWTGPPTDPIALTILGVMGLGSYLLREPDVGSRVSFSFHSIIILGGIVLVGPVGGAIVGAIAYGPEVLRRPRRIGVFNAGMTACYAAVGGVVYQVLGGARDIDQVQGAGALLLGVGLPLLVADVAQCVGNAALLAGVVRVDGGVPFRRFFVQMVTNSGLAYVGYGVIGFLFVILWKPAEVGPFSALLVVAPLFVARWAFVQYGEEQRAHERTLSALVTAVETKDPYAAGHSQRVAQLAEWMAEPLGLGSQETEALRFAAMLHDIGMVGLPTRVIRSRNPVPESERALVTLHPTRGREMVREIHFLADSLGGILHHHEHFDGGGYPSGLRGTDIPLDARVIAVADAFDSLTSARPYRPALSPDDAVRELRARSGTQFDPAVVSALTTVLERHGWTHTGPSQEMVARMGSYYDHDDPTVAPPEQGSAPAVAARAEASR